MSAETATLRMFLLRETASAILVGEDDVNPVRTQWIPRSLIARLSKEPKRGPLTHQPIVFTLPEWKVEQAGLWDFVP